MKKLLISDYDCTINNNGISNRDIEKAHDFINAGNVLIVASSRTCKSLSDEMKKYKFPYNYLSCLNANVIFDDKNDLIYINYLSSKEVELLKFIFSKIGSVKTIEPCGNNETEKILYYKLILEDSRRFVDEILPLLNRYNLETDYYGNVAYVFSGRKQKDYAAFIVGKKHLITSNNTFSIGDGLNDLSMIKKYNGFTLPWGEQKVKEVALEEVSSFGDLVDKIEKGNCLVRRKIN